MKNLYASSRLLLLSIGLSSLLTACKKDSNNSTPPPANNGKSLKVTFRVNSYNDAEGDFVSVSFAGSGTNPSNSTIWKVNGATRTNENGLGFGKTELAAGTTYVVETINPIELAIISYQFINFDSPMSVSFKAEVNGVVQNEDNITLADGQDATKRYQY